MIRTIHQQTDHISKELSKIESRLHLPINSQTCKMLFHKLDLTSHSLQELKQQIKKTGNIFTHSHFSHIEQLEKQACFLYGKALDKKVDFQIEQIRKETTELQKGPTAKIAKQLSQHLKTLLHNHRPGQEHQNTLQQARQTLEGIPKQCDVIKELSALSTEELLELSISSNNKKTIYAALRHKQELSHWNAKALKRCVEEYSQLKAKNYFAETTLEQDRPGPINAAESGRVG